MKEAAGEANLTVVTIILIAAVVAIVTPIITSMVGNAGKKACCTSAGGVWKNNACADSGNGMYDATEYSTCSANASKK